MNEDVKRRGRPPKTHLQEDHHFRTSDDAAAAGAPLAAVESEQADASTVAPASDSVSAEPIVEAVVENPTPVQSVEKGAGIPEVSLESLDIIPSDVISADTSGSMMNTESPIEEKIHQLIDSESLNGWHPIDTEIVLEMPPRNGMAVRLSEDGEGEGILAIWKKTRKFANATHRWQEAGKWVDFHSGMDISFQPKYWKERF